MTQSLGQLPNAPLIYVLAQIVFTRVPKMGDIWEDFHKSIFEVYPESLVEYQQQLSINTDISQIYKDTIWNLLSRDRRKGLILRSDCLILHSTSYITSDDFFNDLAFALERFIKVVPPSIQVHRLGLRYIDLLLPINGLEINQQVGDELNIVNLSSLGCKPKRSTRIINYDTPINGEMIIRYRQTTGTDVLSSDLFPNVLNPAPLLSKPRPPEGTMVGLLDFDHFLIRDVPLERDTIIGLFYKLRETIATTFRTVTTPKVMTAWNEATK